MTSPTIDVRIDELVLHGFKPEDRGRIKDALAQALVSLLTTEGASAALGPGRAVHRARPQTTHLPPDASPELIGAQIAQAVYEGLRR